MQEKKREEQRLHAGKKTSCRPGNIQLGRLMLERREVISSDRTSHRTLQEAGDPFLLLGLRARGGVLGGLEALRHPVTGAALHRGAFGGGGFAHLLAL